MFRRTVMAVSLLLVLAACQKANDNTCVAKVYEKLVLNYPKAEYWSNLMSALRRSCSVSSPGWEKAMPMLAAM